jgi:large subunit ribosomal protein L24
MKIKKGDKVRVVKGKDKGKDGVVEKVLGKNGKVFVAGVNLYKKHQKPKSSDKPGAIIDIAKPIPLTNVMLICTKCGQPARVGFEMTKSEKVRICLKCKAEI